MCSLLLRSLHLRSSHQRCFYRRFSHRRSLYRCLFLCCPLLRCLRRISERRSSTRCPNGACRCVEFRSGACRRAVATALVDASNHTVAAAALFNLALLDPALLLLHFCCCIFVAAVLLLHRFLLLIFCFGAVLSVALSFLFLLDRFPLHFSTTVESCHRQRGIQRPFDYFPYLYLFTTKLSKVSIS